MAEQTDEALVALAGRNETAFMLLFERHREVVFRVALRMTNSVTTAEDITQECFMGLLDIPPRFDPSKGSLRTYLYGAVRNLARRSLGQKYRELHDEDVDPEDVAETDDTTELSRIFLQQEQSQVVRHAISTLPLPQREALILFQYEELPLEEIAVVLGVDTGAVKSRLHRARARLRRILTPYFQGSNTR